MTNHQTKNPNLTHCRNLPFGGRATQGSRVRLPRKKGTRSHHQRLFEENVGKTGTCGLWTSSVKGSGVVFTHREGISTPHVRHKGRQPLIECAGHDFKIMYFPFFMFLCIFPFFMFFSFLWAFFIFYLFVVDRGVSLAPTYPQLWWGNQTYVVLAKTVKLCVDFMLLNGPC